MNLSQALRLSRSTISNQQSAIAFVGAGGKTAAIFQLARELPHPVIVTATTHLLIDNIGLADSHWIGEKLENLAGLEENLRGVMLVTGPVDGDRTTGLNATLISRLCDLSISHSLPLLIEADGSRKRPLKAPADHEPVIPDWVDAVVVVAGLTGLGKPLTEEFVHRPELFALLSGLNVGETISPENLVRVLTHPGGGLKNIPPQARRIALLNQADTAELQALAKTISKQLLSCFHAVVAASLNPPSTFTNRQSKIPAVYEPVAGIVLAAGGSSRYGQPKVLLDWQGRPFVRAVAETALQSGLSPVVVVTGANAEQVQAALRDLPVIIVQNQDWQTGQSSSIRAGLHSLPPPFIRDTSPKSKGILEGSEGVGAAVFLLADQPQTPSTIIRAMCEEHACTLAPIVAPKVQGQRANPVLFDRLTFPNLMALSGDVGGRAIFSKFPVDYLTWHDEDLLSDVDTPEEYRKLVDGK